MLKVITISDTEALCPFCAGKFTRKDKDGEVLKTCPNGHEFVVNIISIINPEKEEE